MFPAPRASNAARAFAASGRDRAVKPAASGNASPRPGASVLLPCPATPAGYRSADARSHRRPDRVQTCAAARRFALARWLTAARLRGLAWRGRRRYQLRFRRPRRQLAPLARLRGEQGILRACSQPAQPGSCAKLPRGARSGGWGRGNPHQRCPLPALRATLSRSRAREHLRLRPQAEMVSGSWRGNRT